MITAIRSNGKVIAERVEGITRILYDELRKIPSFITCYKYYETSVIILIVNRDTSANEGGGREIA